MSRIPEVNPCAAPAPLAFDAVLVPHRSLPPSGFAVVMAVIGGAALLLSVAFFLMGAWPVVGFLGLDIVLVYVAFRLSYRSGRMRERLQLSEEALTVRRIYPSGHENRWRFQPYWLRVEIDDPPRHDSKLTLASHGRRLVIGAFLTASERFEVAQALRAALVKLRCVPSPAPTG